MYVFSSYNTRMRMIQRVIYHDQSLIINHLHIHIIHARVYTLPFRENYVHVRNIPLVLFPLCTSPHVLGEAPYINQFLQNLNATNFMISVTCSTSEFSCDNIFFLWITPCIAWTSVSSFFHHKFPLYFSRNMKNLE